MHDHEICRHTWKPTSGVVEFHIAATFSNGWGQYHTRAWITEQQGNEIPDAGDRGAVQWNW